ncbi:hypothetical protein [Oceaniglobus trochenteri]|uniref:hypothetical protein n=1 Tax=Oceaniglobus trochenteri TaxID=2763260 RepID=UPI001CFFD89A|nr:hypothetical protein [Oceaniglobus trochenteri]
MPPIARFYIRNCLIGFAWAGGFVALLLWFDVARLWSLIAASDVGILAVGLLVMFNGIVFAGVQCGVAVMLMAERDEPPQGGRGAAQLSEAPVTIR